MVRRAARKRYTKLISENTFAMEALPTRTTLWVKKKEAMAINIPIKIYPIGELK